MGKHNGLSKKEKIEMLRARNSAYQEEITELQRENEKLSQENDLFMVLFKGLLAQDILENDETAVKRTTTTISDAYVDGNKTVIKYTDGTKTEAICAKGDTFSREVGVALCVVKKMFGENKFQDLVKQTATKEDRKLAGAYRNLNSPNREKRIKALKTWNCVLPHVRQSIKDRVNNGTL